MNSPRSLIGDGGLSFKSNEKTLPPTTGKCALVEILVVLMKGFEPPTYALRMRCSTS